MYQYTFTIQRSPDSLTIALNASNFDAATAKLEELAEDASIFIDNIEEQVRLISIIEVEGNSSVKDAAPDLSDATLVSDYDGCLWKYDQLEDLWSNKDRPWVMPCSSQVLWEKYAPLTVVHQGGEQK